ncbi:MAG: TetR/AcrR family transcriptional regulator [Spirochaetales bacterium]|nr:TetR/AcrR family transcriptional regulator [Spirochaetales bacterium]
MEENPKGTKQKILDISEQLFAEKGFDNTGIDEIARKVGIAKSVIYYHFKNKKEILDTLFNNFARDLVEKKKEVLERFLSLKGEKRSIGKMYRYVVETFSETNPRMLKILLMESIKKTSDISLFTLWDMNYDFVTTFYGDNIPETFKQDLKDIMFESFFMMLLPQVGFHVLLQGYCKHYGLDEAKTVKKMKSITKTYFDEHWVSRIWKQ